MTNGTTRLRRTRTTTGMSMTELAIRANVAPSTLSLVERGKRPSRRTAEKIAAALGMAPHDLWENCDELRTY